MENNIGVDSVSPSYLALGEKPQRSKNHMRYAWIAVGAGVLISLCFIIPVATFALITPAQTANNNCAHQNSNIQCGSPPTVYVGQQGPAISGSGKAGYNGPAGGGGGGGGGNHDNTPNVEDGGMKHDGGMKRDDGMKHDGDNLHGYRNFVDLQLAKSLAPIYNPLTDLWCYAGDMLNIAGHFYDSNYELLHVQVWTSPGEAATLKFANNEDEADWNTSCSAHKIEFDKTKSKATVTEMHDSFISSAKCTPGMLTNRGLLQAVLLGDRLRDIYVTQHNFIPAVFDDRHVLFRSANSEGSGALEMTCFGIQAGMFGDSRPNEMQIVTRETDFIVADSWKCSFVDILKSHINSQSKPRPNDVDQEVLNFRSVIGNTKYASTKMLNHYTTRICHDMEPFSASIMSNNALAYGAQELLNMKTIIAKNVHAVRHERRNLKKKYINYFKLTVGEILRGLIETADLAVNNAPGAKRFVHFSAASHTVHDMFCHLTGDPYVSHGSASQFILEVYREKGTANPKHNIRLFYNGKIITLDGQKRETVVGIDTRNTYEDFKQFILQEKVFDGAYEEYCPRQ